MIFSIFMDEHTEQQINFFKKRQKICIAHNFLTKVY
jgi:hypothetical protein